MRALRIGICLLSVLVVCMAGGVGEELLSFAVVSLEKAKLGLGDLPSLSAFVFHNYRLNQDHFLFSLAPLVIVLAALPFLDPVVPDWDRKFLYALAAVWLAFISYVFVFTYALMFPITHVGLATDHEATIVTYATIGACVAAIGVLVVLYARGSRQTGEPRR